MTGTILTLSRDLVELLTAVTEASSASVMTHALGGGRCHLGRILQRTNATEFSEPPDGRLVHFHRAKQRHVTFSQLSFYLVTPRSVCSGDVPFISGSISPWLNDGIRTVSGHGNLYDRIRNMTIAHTQVGQIRFRHARDRRIARVPSIRARLSTLGRV